MLMAITQGFNLTLIFLKARLETLAVIVSFLLISGIGILNSQVRHDPSLFTMKIFGSGHLELQ